MNRNFENRKPTKVYAKSKENQMIIKALNMYGRVPETWELLKEIERLNNIINELKWKPIEEYDKGNYDWVLVKYFDGDYECVPCVAEKRFGKWHSIDEKEIKFEVKYFFDMQQLDKLQELKGSDKE